MKSRNLLVWVCLLLMQAFSAHAADSTLTPEEHRCLYNAKQAMDPSNPAAAIRILTDHIRKYSATRHVLIYYTLGNAYYVSGDLKRAGDAYETGLESDPNHTGIGLNLAKVYYETGHYQKAAIQFENAYRLSHPKDPELLYHAAIAYFRVPSYQKAENALDRFIKTKPPNVSDSLKLLIQICTERQDWKKAEQTILMYLNRSPADEEYWRLLATVRFRQKNHRGAASALEIAHQIYPLPVDQLENLAESYLYIGAPLKAARIFEKIYKNSNKPGDYEKLFRAYRQAGDLEKAIHYLEILTERQPTFEFFFEKGKLYLELERWDEAIKTFQSCARIKPNDKQVDFLIGLCAMEIGNDELARRSFTTAAKDDEFRADSVAFLKILDASLQE